MKKIFALLLAIAMVFSFAACGENKADGEKPSYVRLGADLEEYIEEIDEDLGELEEYVYELDEDYCDCDCDDCDDDCCDCDCCDCDDEFDCDGDCDCCDEECDGFYEATCPHCGANVCFDETCDPRDLICPSCQERFDCLESSEA